MALSFSNLTAGTDSGLFGTADSAITASVTIPANGVAYISVALASSTSTGFDITGVTGASLTWAAVAAKQIYGSRRCIRVFRAVNTGSETSGALTISFTSSDSSLQEAEWSVDLATGADTSDPDDAPVSGVATSGTSLALADVGTPDTGDGIFCAFAFESGADSFALGGAFTQLGSQTGGSNVRSLKTGYDLTATLDETPDCSWGTSGNGCGGIGFIVKAAASGLSQDQEGFRFGVDDDTESAHTWAANQDANLTAPLDTNTLLRVLVDATNDPASAAYTLRYQKNGAGGYVAVPVVASVTTSPPQVTSATVASITSANGTWALTNGRPAASAGDMIVAVVAWDDSVAVTSVTPPAGPNSESAVSIAGPQASASTEMRMQAWYWIATGSWTTGNWTYTPSAAETCRQAAFVIPAGQFNAADPIGWANTRASGATNESTLRSPTGTAEADDGSGRLFIAYGSDADAITAPASGTTTVNNGTTGGVGLCIVSRDTTVTNSESIAEITATIASDSWASIGFVVKPAVVSNELYISASANIAAGGEATTARLTAPTGKTTSDFTAGRRWDDENGTDSIDIGADEYTELEWCLKAQSPAADDDYYEFRVYAGANPLDTYTVTPKWTIGSGLNEQYTGTGGASIGGSASLVKIKESVSSGGGITAGVATRSKDKVVTGSGGATMGGTATAFKSATYSFAPSGGVATNGAAVAERVTVHTYLASGLAEVTGAAQASEVKSFTASGGAVSSGTAGLLKEVVPVVAGGAITNGVAAVSRDRAFVMSGGVAASGSAVTYVAVNFIFTPSGGVSVSGTTGLSVDKVFAASGIATMGGVAATEFVNFTEYTGTGGVTVNGAATTGFAASFTFIPSGAVSVSGTATCLFVNLSEYIASGVVALDGSATVTAIKAFSGTGTITCSGVAQYEFQNLAEYTGVGGVAVTGFAPIEVEVVPTTSGGVTVSGNAPYEFTNLTEYVASGGVIVSGSSPVQLEFVLQPSGTVVVSGEADTQFVSFDQDVWVGTGGTTVSGSAEVGFILNRVGSGGAVTGGVAAVVKEVVFVASGEIVASGSALTSESDLDSYLTSGGVTLTGSATIERLSVFTCAPSGGVVVTGNAETKTSALHEYSPAGGVIVSGSTETAITHQYVSTGTGGVVVSGAVSFTTTKAFSPSGGVVISGEVLTEKVKIFTPSGEVVVSGAASTMYLEVNTNAHIGTGGIEVSGVSAVAYEVAPQSSGGAVTDGAAECGVAYEYTATASGGCAVSGTVQVVTEKTCTGAGYAVVSGAAEVLWEPEAVLYEYVGVGTATLGGGSTYRLRRFDTTIEGVIVRHVLSATAVRSEVASVVVRNTTDVTVVRRD